MQAFYDNRPEKFGKIGNGSVAYRYNITEVETTQQDGTTHTQWQCDEVIVWEQVTKRDVVQAVITDKWEANHEQKLVNEYNSAVMGIITGAEATAARTAYTSFLSERKTLKAAVVADCDEAGIL